MSSEPQTIQQQRAQHAQQQIQEVCASGKDELKSAVLACAKGLGSMIQANGLGAAMAFYHSRTGKPEYRTVAAALGNWLTTGDRPLAKIEGGKRGVLDAIVNAEIEQYLAAQAEALAYSVWLKMFAMSMLKEEKPSGGRERA